MPLSEADWDAFVEAAPNGAYQQLSAWARVKRVNGWTAERILMDAEAESGGRIGLQLLNHRIGPSPLGVGYAPRGPIADVVSEAGLGLLTERLRATAGARRLSHITIDPELEAGGPHSDWLQAAGWRPASPVQPDRTRVIDLSAGEETLWSDLRSKWRQYVQKARRNGVVVVETGSEGLDDFYRIYVETATRTGFVHRAKSAYRQVYDAYAARRSARLLFARTSDGRPVATLMLISCGPTVVEPYGGMTHGGAETRANYLLKWEAIRRSREAGFGSYDLWGLAHGGIEQFKVGFGGREVRYIGAWELVTNRPVRGAVVAAQRLRVLLARRLQRLPAASVGEAQ